MRYESSNAAQRCSKVELLVGLHKPAARDLRTHNQLIILPTHHSPFYLIHQSQVNRESEIEVGELRAGGIRLPRGRHRRWNTTVTTVTSRSAGVAPSPSTIGGNNPITQFSLDLPVLLAQLAGSAEVGA